jgi:N-acetylglutamate synthase-like GNAT family acetyltransferase
MRANQKVSLSPQLRGEGRGEGLLQSNEKEIRENDPTPSP